MGSGAKPSTTYHDPGFGCGLLERMQERESTTSSGSVHESFVEGNRNLGRGGMSGAISIQTLVVACARRRGRE